MFRDKSSSSIFVARISCAPPNIPARLEGGSDKHFGPSLENVLPSAFYVLTGSWFLPRLPGPLRGCEVVVYLFFDK
jgi:hypothetical protein